MTLRTCNLLSAFKYEYGTKLKYIGMTAQTKIIASSMGYPTGLPIRDAWEDFASTEVSGDIQQKCEKCLIIIKM